jgi:hypothetical protein
LSNTDFIPSERIEKAIYLLRGEKVMLDRDLAELYQVQTKALNQPYVAIATGFSG